MQGLEPFVAHTDHEWYDFLSTQASGGRLDEVNFWFPKATRPPREFHSGDPVFFRLGAPDRKIAGYAFFAKFMSLPVSLAWETFGVRNGAPDLSSFLRLIRRSTAEDLARPVGCMILLDAHFWPDARWIPWGEERSYAKSGNVRGRTASEPENAAALLAELQRDGVEPPPELREEFHPVEVDERQTKLIEQTVREGQGAFRLRLLDAYGGCAGDGRAYRTGARRSPYSALPRSEEQ